MENQILELLNQAQELIGKEPPTGQFDAYPRYLKVTDIMDILQVSRSKARTIMYDPTFPLIKLGRSIRVEREQFFQWVRQKERSA
jgi:predicted DNA-binding transcriptional regulator AlpA